MELRSIVKKKNKKGNIIGLIVFIGVLFMLLMAGFILAVGGGVVNYTFDEVVPELVNFGMVENVNLTQIADVTIVPANNVVQQLSWFGGVLYVMCLFASLGFAMYSRFSPNRWLMGFYFLLMLMLILGSIFISNMYEEFHNGTDDFALRLQEQTLLSFMIIYSPAIFTIIGFITGIIMFSGMRSEDYV